MHPALGHSPANSERLLARALLELASVTYGEWPEFTRHLVQFDAEVLRVERVTLWSLDENGESARCDAGYVVRTRSFERGATMLVARLRAFMDALRDARVLAIEDVFGDPRTREIHEYARIRGMSSCLAVPLWVDGRLAGLLSHEHVGPKRRWSATEEDFATGAGRIVASTLAARSRTGAEAAARRAAFLDGVSRQLLESLEARAIADRVVGLVVPRFAEFAALWGFDAGCPLTPLAWVHADPANARTWTEAVHAAAADQRLPVVQYVVSQGQSLLYSEILPASLEHFDGPQRERLEALRPRTALLVPVSAAGRTMGAMLLAASDRHYGGDDLDLAEAVASRAAAALENARLYEVARRAVATRDEFLHLAAHELRTPLTALQLVAEGVARRSGTDSAGSAIVRQVRRLGAIVEHMLDAARIQTGGITLTPESYDLRSVVLDRAGMAAGRAAEKGSGLSIHAEAPLRGRWDRARIGQVVDELLDNAIKFGRGRPIEVTLEQDDGWAVLAVSDHGVGLPADRLASIFSPFEGAAPREQFGGLGLGLYITKAIVVTHGGSIAVDSRLGEGTKFVVRLPIFGDARAGRAARQGAGQPSTQR